MVTSYTYPPAPCGHGCATCKVGILRRMARDHHPTIYIGDGLSDRFAVEESDVVFAKRKLAAYCQERGVACQQFENFAEIESAVRGLIGKPPARRPRPSVAPVTAD